LRPAKTIKVSGASSVLEQMLSWCPNSTLHCIPLMHPSQYYLLKISFDSSLSRVNINISPYAAPHGLSEFRFLIECSGALPLYPESSVWWTKKVGINRENGEENRRHETFPYNKFKLPWTKFKLPPNPSHL
jgi:hypothetical protein